MKEEGKNGDQSGLRGWLSTKNIEEFTEGLLEHRDSELLRGTGVEFRGLRTKNVKD